MGKLNLCHLVQVRHHFFPSQFLLVAEHANVAMVNLPTNGDQVFILT